MNLVREPKCSSRANCKFAPVKLPSSAIRKTAVPFRGRTVETDAGMLGYSIITNDTSTCAEECAGRLPNMA